MPTIVSDEKGFAFLHVPKTGGTSFGRQIASQTAHDPEFYEGILKDPELGAFYRDHLTLPMYAKHYPQTLQKLRDYTAYAIIRDPYARFKSAFAQLSRVTGAGEISQVPPDQVEALLLGTMAKLQDHRAYELHLIYFRPVHSFVVLDGVTLVDRLYHIKAADKLAEELKEQFSIDLDTASRERVTPQYDRQKFKRFARFQPVAEKLIPPSALARIKGGIKRAISVQQDPEFDRILAKHDARGFVEEYYRNDYELLANQAIHG